MGKLNWRDVDFLACEVARMYAKHGYDQGNGARILALAWCLEVKPGFDAGKFVQQVNEILRRRRIAA